LNSQRLRLVSSDDGLQYRPLHHLGRIRPGLSDLAFGTRGEITTTFPQTALGARATTVLVEPPRTSWSAAAEQRRPKVARRT
jgi:hypothetical protein